MPPNSAITEIFDTEVNKQYARLSFVVVNGCADLAAPDNAWVRRSGDTLQVGCNFTAERWHLVCKANDWIGSFGNCSGSASHSRGAGQGIGVATSGSGQGGNLRGKNGE